MSSFMRKHAMLRSWCEPTATGCASALPTMGGANRQHPDGRTEGRALAFSACMSGSRRSVARSPREARSGGGFLVTATIPLAAP